MITNYDNDELTDGDDNMINNYEPCWYVMVVSVVAVEPLSILHDIYTDAQSLQDL